LRNATRIYKIVFVTLVAIAAVCVAIILGAPEYGGDSGSSESSLKKSDSGLQSNFQPQVESPTRQSAIAEAIPWEKELSNPTLAQTVSVWGTIRTESGAVTNLVRVLFYSLSLDMSYSTLSNPNGYFYIDSLKPAKDYGLWVVSGGLFRRYVRQGIDISFDQTEVSVLLQDLPAGTLTGEVVNSSGVAVAEFGIKIRSPNKTIWAASVVTDRFGGFEVENAPIGEVEFLSTFGQAMLITGHVFEGDRQSPFILVVDQGPYELNGRVYDQNNDLVIGANVSLGWVNAEGGTRSVINRYSITDSSGQFSMVEIGPGEHELVLTATAGSTYRQTIDIGNDGADLTIRLPHTPLTN
jgi:hypothetical protein